MFNLIKKSKKKDNKGFTLVELVIVIAILAILVGLLAPQYTKYVEKSRKAADASNMDEMVKVVKVFAADPANELPVADYTIKIGDGSTNNTGTSITSTETATTVNNQEVKKGLEALKTEMGKSIPNWESTTTKSKKWKNGESASIIAKVSVKEDGGTSVVYNVDGYTVTNTAPDPFANYMSTGTDGIE